MIDVISLQNSDKLREYLVVCVNACSGNLLLERLILFLKVELKVGSEKTVQNRWCNSPTQTGMDFSNEEQKGESTDEQVHLLTLGFFPDSPYSRRNGSL